MRFSKNFTLDELCVTNTGFANIPSETEKQCLKDLVVNVLQPLRDIYGKPIHINSGYRCSLVNKKIGGKPNSQHLKGQAADIDGGNREENKKLLDLIQYNLEYDQAICEHDYQWIHVSFNKGHNRKQILYIK